MRVIREIHFRGRLFMFDYRWGAGHITKEEERATTFKMANSLNLEET